MATLLYSENFDSVADNYPTGWSFSGTATAEILTPVEQAINGWGTGSDYQGASGHQAFGISNGGGASSGILTGNDSISTVGYINLYVVIGFFKESDAVTPTIEWSVNGSTWNALSFTDVASSTTWQTKQISLSSSANNAANIQFRLTWTYSGSETLSATMVDDFLLYGDLSLMIKDTPQQYEPVHNDLPFVVSGSNNTQSNYKYWCDLYFSGSTTYDYRLFTFPRPDGFGFFNLRPIIRDYVVGDLSIPTTEGFNRVSDMYKAYSVHFGESYGSATGAVTSGLVSSGTYYAFDGSLEWEEFLDYSQNDRLVRVTTGGAKLLTNKNSNVATDFTSYNLIGDSENEWLFMMIKDPLAVSTANIEVFNSSQSSIGSFTVTNPYKALGSEGDRFLMFPCGTNNLNNIDSGSVTVNSGSLPIIDSDVAYYNISFGGVSTITREYMFKVETNCEKYDAYRLQYKNKWGGYDGFTFTLKNREFGNIERKQYKRQYGRISSTGDWSYTKADRGIVTYSTKSKRRLSLVSNWITEAQYENLIELIESPKVFWDNSSELHAVNILNTDYEVKIYKNEKLINLEIEVEFTQMNRRQ